LLCEGNGVATEDKKQHLLCERGPVTIVNEPQVYNPKAQIYNPKLIANAFYHAGLHSLSMCFFFTLSSCVVVIWMS